MWRIDEAAVEQIATGAGILGTGGGGNPYLGKLHLLRLLREGATPPRSSRRTKCRTTR